MYNVRDVHQLYKVAVYTDTNSCKSLERLDMNIRCVRTERVFNDSRCKLNDRRAVDTLRGFLVDTERVVVVKLVLNAFEQRGRILRGVLLSYGLCNTRLC